MDMVVELRKLEGINTSFDYGVELVVMGVKQNPSLQEIDVVFSIMEKQLEPLFNFDKVCKNGYEVAKERVLIQNSFFEQYLEMIRVFRYDETVYGMRSEPKILLFASDFGSIRRTEETEEMVAFIEDFGFKCRVNELADGDVEFEVMPRV